MFEFPFEAETLWHLYLVSKLIIDVYLTPWMRQSILVIRLGKKVLIFHGTLRFTEVFSLAHQETKS